MKNIKNIKYILMPSFFTAGELVRQYMMNVVYSEKIKEMSTREGVSILIKVQLVLFLLSVVLANLICHVIEKFKEKRQK